MIIAAVNKNRKEDHYSILAHYVTKDDATKLITDVGFKLKVATRFVFSDPCDLDLTLADERVSSNPICLTGISDVVQIEFPHYDGKPPYKAGTPCTLSYMLISRDLDKIIEPSCVRDYVKEYGHISLARNFNFLMFSGVYEHGERVIEIFQKLEKTTGIKPTR